MARMALTALTYETAQAFLNGKSSRKLGHNTWLEERREGSYIDYAVRYYSTDIVTVTRQNIYILNTGGHRTVTTKQRINTLAPVRVYQTGFAWYLDDGMSGGRMFYDGMRVNDYGAFLG